MMSSLADLPEEVLEHVFLHLSPYGDIQVCRCVNHKWHRIGNGTLERLRTLFLKCNSFEWALLQPPDEGGPVANIAERCSHAATYHEESGSVFVFGGCTMAYTTFNDLWRFDLRSRRWVRPLPMGDHPTPKACATMVTYKGRLVLFGGWSKSSPNPIHQTAMFFNELHFYDPNLNYWKQVVDPSNSAPHLAGHSATIIDDYMVVFGGSHGSGSSNRVWVYNFVTNQWFTPHVAPGRPLATGQHGEPLPRYGHSQIRIDNCHLLIVGGCGGPNLIFSDIWLLTLDFADTQTPWRWSEIPVENPASSPPQIWSHPGCRVGDKVLFLSKGLKSRLGPSKLFREMSRTSGYRPEDQPGPSNSNSSDLRNPHGDTAGSRGGSARGWVPPTGNLIPPRRKVLISSKSLDEQAPPPSPRLGIDGGQGELIRAQSIPAIIVGEIPKLVVTEDNPGAGNSAQPGGGTGNPAGTDQGNDIPGPSNANNAQPQSSQCIVLAASSLLPNQAVPVAPPPPPAASMSPPTTSGGHVLHRNTPYPSVKPNAMRNREKQLQMLRKMEEYIARSRSSTLGSDRSTDSSSREGSQSPGETLRFRPSSPPPQLAGPGGGRRSSREIQQRNLPVRNPMHIYLLDTTRVLDPVDPSVVWSVDVFSCYEAPEDTILYSLVKGRGELIMFGGMRSTPTGGPGQNLDVTPFITNTITNETYIIRPDISSS